jgi:arginine/lysine/ornithine decarboxylase
VTSSPRRGRLRKALEAEGVTTSPASATASLFVSASSTYDGVLHNIKKSKRIAASAKLCIVYLDELPYGIVHKTKYRIKKKTKMPLPC